MKTLQDFLHIMDFNGNQTVQGFSAASNGFKRHQTMNKGLKVFLKVKYSFKDALI